jgi:outer membrane protein insertion porin family
LCVLLLSLLSVAALAQQPGAIQEIVVRGNVVVSREAILAAMRTRVGQPYIQENLDQDRRSIEELGFFQHVDVRATPIEAGDWRVTVDVQEFPVIKEIRITGNEAVPTQDIVEVLTLRPGDIYNLNQLRPTAVAIAQLYQQRGYFADIADISPLPESPNTLNIAIIETRVGTVEVQGNVRTRPFVFERLIRTRPGEPFNAQTWTSDLRRLINTQFFEEVRSVENVDREVGRIDLVAVVREARTGMFNVGVQVDPRTSFAGVLRLSEMNWRGTGQSVSVGLLQTTRGDGPSVDLDYANPFFGDDLALRASLYSRLVYRFAGAFGGGTPVFENRYTERRTGGMLGLTRTIRDTLTLGGAVRYDNVNTLNVPSATPDPGAGIGFIQQDGDVGVISLAATLNRRDVDVDPSRGDWIRVEVQPGFANIRSMAGPIQDPDVLGTSTFLKTAAEYRRYFSMGQPPRERDLTAPRRVLAFRSRIGSIAGTVPFFEQFFAGGSDTLRGYPEDRFWGRHSFLTTVEYRHPLQPALNVIAFVDYGGAWGGYPGFGNVPQSEGVNLHLGYGVGLAFRTPLGPIRLDVGFNEQGRSRAHFLIGQSF